MDQRKINLLTKLHYSSQKNQRLLENILSGLETSTSHVKQTQPPMPPLDQYAESIASTGSITTNSPMFALQGYSSESDDSEPDSILNALKSEFWSYPNVD